MNWLRPSVGVSVCCTKRPEERGGATAIHGGRVYEYAKALGARIEDVLDFSANINPLGPPHSVWPAVESAWSLVRHYPDYRHSAVKNAIAQAFGIEPTHIVCGNGAAEVMDLLVRLIRPARTWILDPAFSEYESIARRYGSAVCTLSLWHGDAHALPMEELGMRMKEGDLLIINTPHNPSGVIFHRATWMDRVRGWTQAGIHVLVDESFLDFYKDAADETAMYAAVNNPCLHVVRSATKIFAIPGLRFGFCVVHSDVASKIERERDGWSVNAFAQVAAQAAYAERTFLAKTHAWLQTVQGFVEDTWRKEERLTVYPSAANFVLIRHQSVHVAVQWRADLEAQNILVRDCSTYRTLDETYVRIAFRTDAENEQLWLASSRILNRIAQR